MSDSDYFDVYRTPLELGIVSENSAGPEEMDALEYYELLLSRNYKLRTGYLRINGRLFILSSTIDGDLNFACALFNDGLTVLGVTVKGDLILENAESKHGMIDIFHVRVEGDLYLGDEEGVDYEGRVSQRMRLSEISVGGRIFF